VFWNLVGDQKLVSQIFLVLLLFTLYVMALKELVRLAY
jgi:hypothetical protein